MARLERFELPTTWFEARYSIQLSYGRIHKRGTIYQITDQSTKCFTPDFHHNTLFFPLCEANNDTIKQSR